MIKKHHTPPFTAKHVTYAEFIGPGKLHLEITITITYEFFPYDPGNPYGPIDIASPEVPAYAEIINIHFDPHIPAVYEKLIQESAESGDVYEQLMAETEAR